MLNTIKLYWQKYSWLVCLILLGVVVTGWFRPAEVKLVEYKTVDTSWKQTIDKITTKIQTQYANSMQEIRKQWEKSTELVKNINTETVETYDPKTGVLISRTTRIIDLSKINSNATATTTSTVTINSGNSSTETTKLTEQIEALQKEIDKIKKTETRISPASLLFQYNSVGEMPAAGAGLNLDPNTTVGGGGEYSFEYRRFGWWASLKTAFLF